ncbi:MAG: hypothetical protein LBN29_03425 [Mediterranea sp.]|jgi:hypothetical protein|nr:hypothetical protein [Mediterranea sp.]
MKRISYLILPLFLLMVGVKAKAQSKEDSLLLDNMYKKQLIWELGAGVNVSLAPGGVGDDILQLYTHRNSLSYVLNWLHFTHFFSKRWGWFFNFSTSGINMNAGRAVKKTFEAWGEKYYVDSYGWKDRMRTDMDLHAGFAYRMESKRWIFYPRLGVGMAIFSKTGPDGTVLLKERGGQGMYVVEYFTNYLPKFSLSPGFSIGYKFSPGVRLTLNTYYVHPFGKTTFTEAVQNAYTDAIVSERIFHASNLYRHLNVSLNLSVPVYPNTFKRKERMKRSRTGGISVDYSKPRQKRMEDLMRQKRERFGWNKKKK